MVLLTYIFKHVRLYQYNLHLAHKTKILFAMFRHKKEHSVHCESFSYIKRVCMFELMPYVPVNSHSHVWTLPLFYVTFTQKLKAQTAYLFL